MSDSSAMELDTTIQGQEEQARNNQINPKYPGDNAILSEDIVNSNTEGILCETKLQEADETAKEPKISLESEVLLSDAEITKPASVESEIRSSAVERTTSAAVESTGVPTKIEMIVGAGDTSGTVSPPAVRIAESAEMTVLTVTESEVDRLPGGTKTLSTDVEENESMPCEALPNEANIGSIMTTILSNAEGKTDQQIMDNQSKENYRTMEDSSESDDSDSEDSDSSSVCSGSSSSEAGKGDGNNGGSDADCDDSQSLAANKKKGSYPMIKVKGELQPEDLPQIEELHISVPSSLCAEIGVVTSLVNTLVVIQAHKGLPALDLESVLFVDNGSRALGLVFDVLGPVNEPLYCVRFNSTKHIEEFQVKPGDKVYFAPSTAHSKYIFLQQLLRMKGSDASWRNDIEPTVQIDFSDDEEERKAKKGSTTPLKSEEDQLKRKREQTEDSKGQAREQADKMKHMPQKRNAQWRPQGGGNPTTGQMTSRPRYQSSQYSNHGHIRPPSFNVPDFSTPPPTPPQNSAMYDRGNACYNYPPPVSQGSYSSQPYQNPMQPTSSFGQLPYAPVQNQLDPRLVQFGAQFVQMMCALQASTTPAVNVPPPPPPSFNLPYNQSAFPGGNQSSGNSFNNPPPQNQAPYSLPPFNAPPPPPPHPNLPPPGTSRAQPPAHNYSSFGRQYSSPHSSSYRGRR